MLVMGQSRQSRGEEEAISEAMDRLWKRFLPEIEERVALLESASVAITRRELTEERRETARAAAHKLAGVLGTFGLTRGTVLARQLEMVFSRKLSGAAQTATHQLPEVAAEIRALVEHRNSAA